VHHASPTNPTRLRPMARRRRRSDSTAGPDRTSRGGKERGALPSRLHKHGQVLGRGTTRVIVQFDDEHTVVRIRPYLVRVLTHGERSPIPAPRHRC
jgi:hypothetical protein